MGGSVMLGVALLAALVAPVFVTGVITSLVMRRARRAREALSAREQIGRL